MPEPTASRSQCIRGIDVDRRQHSHSDWPSIVVDSVSHSTNWDLSILSSVVSTVSGEVFAKGADFKAARSAGCIECSEADDGKREDAAEHTECTSCPRLGNADPRTPLGTLSASLHILECNEVHRVLQNSRK